MAKLTLSVDEGVIRLAKRYAEQSGTSISRLVERYLSFLARPPAEPESNRPRVVARLRGALKGASEDVEDYRRYLREKYR